MKRQKKKRVRLPMHICLMYIAVCSLALVGVTFARYITKTTSGDSARVIKMGKLTLNETPTNGDTPYVTPGVEIEKQATVSFEGSEAACYLFVAVDGMMWNNTEAEPYQMKAESGKISWIVPQLKEGVSGWNYLYFDGAKYVYYVILPANKVIDKKEIIKGGKITVSPELTNTELSKWVNIPIGLEAAVVQYDGFGETLPTGYTQEEHAKTAWESLKNK